MKHYLKVWPEYFQPTLVGDKTFEIRKNDRHFHERDQVVLQEWDNIEEEYTGREMEGIIRYMTDYGQKEDYIVFSVEIQYISEG